MPSERQKTTKKMSMCSSDASQSRNACLAAVLLVRLPHSLAIPPCLALLITSADRSGEFVSLVDDKTFRDSYLPQPVTSGVPGCRCAPLGLLTCQPGLVEVTHNSRSLRLTCPGWRAEPSPSAASRLFHLAHNPNPNLDIRRHREA